MTLPFLLALLACQNGAVPWLGNDGLDQDTGIDREAEGDPEEPPEELADADYHAVAMATALNRLMISRWMDDRLCAVITLASPMDYPWIPVETPEHWAVEGMRAGYTDPDSCRDPYSDWGAEMAWTEVAEGEVWWEPEVDEWYYPQQLSLKVDVFFEPDSGVPELVMFEAHGLPVDDGY